MWPYLFLQCILLNFTYQILIPNLWKSLLGFHAVKIIIFLSFNWTYSTNDYGHPTAGIFKPQHIMIITLYDTALHVCPRDWRVKSIPYTRLHIERKHCVGTIIYVFKNILCTPSENNVHCQLCTSKTISGSRLCNAWAWYLPFSCDATSRAQNTFRISNVILTGDAMLTGVISKIKTKASP